MLISDNTSQKRLPTMEELPYQDGKPVDSELQDLIAHLLKSILAYIWPNRNDWFFGIDIGWYYDPNKSAIAPPETRFFPLPPETRFFQKTGFLNCLDAFKRFPIRVLLS